MDADAELPLLLMPKEYFELNAETLEGTGHALSDFKAFPSLINSMQKPPSPALGKSKKLSTSTTRPVVQAISQPSEAAWSVRNSDDKIADPPSESGRVIRGETSADVVKPPRAEEKPSKRQKPEDG